jgi:small conductance mechanosensitive channel
MDEQDSLQVLDSLQVQSFVYPKDSINVNVFVNVKNTAAEAAKTAKDELDTARSNDPITEQMTASVKTSWDKITDKLSGWMEDLVLNLPNFILALLIFALFYWLSRHVKSWINRLLIKAVRQTSVRSLIANFASIVVLGIGFLMALNVLNLNEVLTSLLAGAGVAGLAIGLALQGTLANTFSGIFLAIRDVISIGDWVDTNGYSGEVVNIDLRNTQIKEGDNNIVVIPNQMILDNPFKNYGLTKRIRSTINCGVGYESDLEKVRDVARDAIRELYPPEPNENIEFHYLEFGGSSIDFQLRFWVNSKQALTAFEAKSKAIVALKKAFDKHDINIPFPIRTVFHYDETERSGSEEQERDEKPAPEKDNKKE